MAQQNKRRYRVRYDRIIFCAVILAVLILLMSSCIRSCGKTPTELDTESTNSLDDQLETSAPTEPGSSAGKTDTGSVTYATISKSSEDIHTGDLILVNEEYPCEFDDAAIQDGTSADVSLISIHLNILDNKEKPWHYTVADYTTSLDKTAAYAMDAWFEAFYDQDHDPDLRTIIGYRSDSEDQDYHTGRTCTIGIYHNDERGSGYYKPEGSYAWLAEHAAEYGFIQRYPEEKNDFFDDNVTTRRSSTFRYVGVAPATYITENNLCLEEFLEEVKDHSIDNMLKVTSGDAQYGIYYIPSNTSSKTTSFSVPKDKSYEISGNNMDGFVIVVALNDAAGETKTATPDYEDLDE